jgi:hypothetical protein
MKKSYGDNYMAPAEYKKMKVSKQQGKKKRRKK